MYHQRPIKKIMMIYGTNVHKTRYSKQINLLWNIINQWRSATHGTQSTQSSDFMSHFEADTKQPQEDNLLSCAMF